MVSETLELVELAIEGIRVPERTGIDDDVGILVFVVVRRAIFGAGAAVGTCVGFGVGIGVVEGVLNVLNFAVAVVVVEIFAVVFGVDPSSNGLLESWVIATLVLGPFGPLGILLPIAFDKVCVRPVIEFLDGARTGPEAEGVT